MAHHITQHKGITEERGQILIFDRLEKKTIWKWYCATNIWIPRFNWEI